MWFIYIIIGGVLGYWMGKKGSLLSSSSRFGSEEKSFNEMDEVEMKKIHSKAKEAFNERLEERLEKIFEFIGKEMEHQKALANCSIEDGKVGVSREDIEKLLDISGMTALKYLNELENKGKIEQVGKSGQGVYYVLK